MRTCDGDVRLTGTEWCKSSAIYPQSRDLIVTDVNFERRQCAHLVEGGKIELVEIIVREVEKFQIR